MVRPRVQVPRCCACRGACLTLRCKLPFVCSLPGTWPGAGPAPCPVAACLLRAAHSCTAQKWGLHGPCRCFALSEIILQLPLIFTNSWIWTLMVRFALLLLCVCTLCVHCHSVHCCGGAAAASCAVTHESMGNTQQHFQRGSYCALGSRAIRALDTHFRSGDLIAGPWLLPCMQVYFMVGFNTSARLLVFWAFMFIAAVWSHTYCLAVASIARIQTLAIAVQGGPGRRALLAGVGGDRCLHDGGDFEMFLLGFVPAGGVFGRTREAGCGRRGREGGTGARS